jgi:hypothetical protein
MDLKWLQPIVESLTDSIVNSPGGGGIIFIIVLGTAALVYILATRWILAGEDGEDTGNE